MKEIKTFSDLYTYTKKFNISVFEICTEQEANETNSTKEEIRSTVKKTLNVMKKAISNGILTFLYLYNLCI